MIYGYVRVSTDKQMTDNQRFEIARYCEKNSIAVDSWIEETVSGIKDVNKRKLGLLLKDVKKGDLIIMSELSRLGRSLFMIISILQQLLEKGVQVWTIKDNFKLGNDIQSKMLAFAFGMCAEIERDLISQRTKEALGRKVAEGITLGRPVGRKSSRLKLTGKEDEICRLRKEGLGKLAISRIFNVNRMTVDKFMREKGIV